MEKGYIMFEIDSGHDRRLLLVASTGGHLSQLVRLAPDFRPSDDSLWVTFKSPQSESLLAGKNVHYVPYIRPRDYRGVRRGFTAVNRLLQREQFDGAVSTGSALALGALPAARLHGVPCLYIESISRINGPSVTGRLLAASRMVSLRTQHPQWATARWRPHASVLATFERVDKHTASSRPKLFITLGTIEGYRFDRLIDQILATGLAGDDTVWQLGYSTGRTDLPGRVFDQIPASDFEKFSKEADVVVTHAGVGTILFLLDLGIYPVAVVRRHEHGEHIDDHQEQIASLLRTLQVGHSAEVDELDADLICDAARFAVRGTVEEHSSSAPATPAKPAT